MMTATASPLLRLRKIAVVPREDWSVLTLTVTFIIIVALVSANIHGGPFQPAWFANNIMVFTWLGVGVLLTELTGRIALAKPDSPVAFVLSYETGQWLTRRVFASLPIIAVALYMPGFSTMKSSIPLMSAFAWDQTFIALDRTIHGTDAWRILQPAMGHAPVTYAASTLYHLWFGLIYVGPFLFAWYAADRRLRLRFFLAFIGSWTVVGILAATLFASVGPAFVGPIMGIDDFAPQMEYLYSVDAVYPLAVLDVQQQLLIWYDVHEYGLGRGITAMPSMHVALAWLYVLATWKLNRRLGKAFAAFFVATLLSSVHLAYHYAVDGYVSIALVSLVWWACGRIVARLAPPCVPASAPSELA